MRSASIKANYKPSLSFLRLQSTAHITAFKSKSRDPLPDISWNGCPIKETTQLCEYSLVNKYTPHRTQGSKQVPLFLQKFASGFKPTARKISSHSKQLWTVWECQPTQPVSDDKAVSGPSSGTVPLEVGKPVR